MGREEGHRFNGILCAKVDFGWSKGYWYVYRCCRRQCIYLWMLGSCLCAFVCLPVPAALYATVLCISVCVCV